MWDSDRSNYVLVPVPGPEGFYETIHKSEMPKWREHRYAELKLRAAAGGAEDVRELAAFIADNLDEPDFRQLLQDEKKSA